MILVQLVGYPEPEMTPEQKAKADETLKSLIPLTTSGWLRNEAGIGDKGPGR